MSFFKPKKKKDIIISPPINTQSQADVFQNITNPQNRNEGNPARISTGTAYTSVSSVNAPYSRPNEPRHDNSFNRTPSVLSTTSSNSNTPSMLSDQTRVSTYSMQPSDTALDELFEALMDSMDMKENQRVAMRALPPDSKWKMIRSQKDKEHTDIQKRMDGLLDKSTPEFFVHKMKEFESSLMPLKNFTYLRVSLATQPISWVKQFIYLNGMELLADALGSLNRRVSRREADNKIELEIVKSLKALLNTGCGGNEALQTPKIIYNLTFSIDSKNLTTRKLVADALIYLCCSEDAIGHSHVLEGMDKMQKFRQHSMRFEGWMVVLEATILGRGRMGSLVGASEEIRRAGADKDLMDYCLSNIMLINALIEIPEELEVRMHIRSQLNLVKLGTVLKLLKELGNELINLQIRKFERVAELDMAEWVENHNNTVLQNMNDPRDVFETLLQSVGETRAYDFFLSALQHMLLIRYDTELKTRYFQVIDAVITDIVLDQSYFDSGYARQNGSVATIISKFEKEEQLEKSLIELKETKEQLHKVIGRKNELELELSMREDDMVTALKSRIHSLENLLRMSHQTCEALRNRSENIYSELDGKLSRQDKQLKHVYSVFQKEIEEKQKAEIQREELQIENELLKSGKFMEKTEEGKWVVNFEKVSVEVTRIRVERNQQKQNAQQTNPLAALPLQGTDSYSGNITFEEVGGPSQAMPMPVSRPTSTSAKHSSRFDFSKYAKDGYGQQVTADQIVPEHPISPEKRFSIMPVPSLPQTGQKNESRYSVMPMPSVSQQPYPYADGHSAHFSSDSAFTQVDNVGGFKLPTVPQESGSEGQQVSEHRPVIQGNSTTVDGKPILTSGGSATDSAIEKLEGAKLGGSISQPIGSAETQTSGELTPQANPLENILAAVESTPPVFGGPPPPLTPSAPVKPASSGGPPPPPPPPFVPNAPAQPASSGGPPPPPPPPFTPGSTVKPLSGSGPPPPPPPPPAAGGPPPPPPPPMSGGPPPPPPPPSKAGIPPPPPPPGGMGGPPPPPPPPGGRPGPPPPPGTMSGPPPPPMFGAPAVPSLPQRKKLKVMSKVKLKQLQWDKLSNSQISKTIWKDISSSDEPVVDQFVEHGIFTKIEEEFSAKEIVARVKAAKVETDASAEDKVQLLDSKKTYTMNIMLGSLKNLSFKVIHKAIITLDESVLNENLVKQFLNYVPTPEEVELLMGYTGEFDSLARPEQFLTEMIKIYRYEARLNSIYFKFGFMDQFNYLDKSISSVIEASVALSNSKHLPQLFKIILVIGNYMNGTGFRGGAHGFKVYSLTKLADTKAMDNKSNLIHFLVRTLSSMYPAVLDFRSEVRSAEAASKVSFSDLMSDFQSMGHKLKDIKEELETYFEDTSELPPEDTWHVSIGKFYTTAQRSYATLELRYEEMNKAYGAIVTSLGEDPLTTGPDEFFVVFREFLALIEKAFKEIKVIDEKNAKLEKQRLEQEAKEKAMLEKQKAKEEAKNKPDAPGSKTDDADAVGAMDKLLESLRSGADFTSTRRYKNRLQEKKAKSSSIGLKAMEMLQEMKLD